LAGTSIGTFHNSTSQNFVEQLAFAPNGNILAASFSSNNVGFLDPNNGNLLAAFTASGARGVHQLANGNIMWTNAGGVSLYDITTGTSSQVYAGGGRFLDFAPVPEPSTVAVFSAGAVLLGLRVWRAKKRASS
jgi:hypothetical protein